jgi:hypothetical protein
MGLSPIIKHENKPNWIMCITPTSNTTKKQILKPQMATIACTTARKIIIPTKSLAAFETTAASVTYG